MTDVVEYGWTGTGAPNHRYTAPILRRLLEGGSLLDVGCGGGELSALAADLGCETTAVDVSEDGLELASLAFPQVRFERASAYDDLTVFAPDGGFDTVMALEVIEHLYSPATALERMREALKPGGRLIVAVPYHGWLMNVALSVTGKWDNHFGPSRDGWHIKFFSRRTLVGLVESAGFTVTDWFGAGRHAGLWHSQFVVATRP